MVHTCFSKRIDVVIQRVYKLLSSRDNPLQPPEWLRGKWGLMPLLYHPCPSYARLSPARRERCAGRACPPGPVLYVSWTFGNTLESGKWRRTSQQSPRHLESGIKKMLTKKSNWFLTVCLLMWGLQFTAETLGTAVHLCFFWYQDAGLKEGISPEPVL